MIPLDILFMDAGLRIERRQSQNFSVSLDPSSGSGLPNVYGDLWTGGDEALNDPLLTVQYKSL